MFAATTRCVSPSNPNGWVFVNEGATGSRDVRRQAGYAAAREWQRPAYRGRDPEREDIATGAFVGTRLDQISALSYAAYKQARRSVRPSLAPEFRRRLQPDRRRHLGTRAARLRAVPGLTRCCRTERHPGRPTTPTLASGGHLEGTRHRIGVGASAIASAPPAPAPAQVLSNFPNAGISGALLLRAGGPWNGGFVGNADALSITVNGANTTYDFELVAFPTSADQCKKDGWKSFVNADGGPLFKNQGDCVSYVQTGGKNAPSGR